MNVWMAYMLTYVARWISVGIAVSVAIYTTGKWSMLWFFLIPAIFGTHVRDTRDKTELQDSEGE